MRNKIFGVLFLLFVFLVGCVSAEKVWSFHNYSLNVSDDIELAGNLSTTGTGFFGFLGSLVSRVEGLFVEELDVLNDVEIGGHVNPASRL